MEGNPHRKQPLYDLEQSDAINAQKLSYRELAIGGFFCECTAADGHICAACKTEQKEMAAVRQTICFGSRCNQHYPMDELPEAKVCLWCYRPLPSSHNFAESRRKYDDRHMLARAHSSYERPERTEDGQLEENVVTSYEGQIAIERDIQTTADRVRDHHRYLSHECADDECACGSHS